MSFTYWLHCCGSGARSSAVPAAAGGIALSTDIGSAPADGCCADACSAASARCRIPRVTRTLGGGSHLTPPCAAASAPTLLRSPSAARRAAMFLRLVKSAALQRPGAGDGG